MEKTRIRIPDNVVLQKVADETVLLNIDDGQYYGLDPIGTRFLELLQKSDRDIDIVDQLLREYDASREQVENDLGDLIRRLESAALIIRD